jgi:hypothetical protein
MGQYVVTIVPVEGDGDAGTGPVAQTIVRIDTGSGRPIVKELTVRAPEGASLGGALPYVDFDLLLRAFVEPSGGRARRTAAPRPARAPAAAPARTRPGTRPSALTAGRAYRKAPEPGELEEVYGRVGTISAVAAHFAVPVHTAQGWISRMRRRNAQAQAPERRPTPRGR